MGYPRKVIDGHYHIEQTLQTRLDKARAMEKIFTLRSGNEYMDNLVTT